MSAMVRIDASAWKLDLTLAKRLPPRLRPLTATRPLDELRSIPLVAGFDWPTVAFGSTTTSLRRRTVMQQPATHRRHRFRTSHERLAKCNGYFRPTRPGYRRPLSDSRRRWRADARVAFPSCQRALGVVQNKPIALEPGLIRWSLPPLERLCLEHRYLAVSNRLMRCTCIASRQCRKPSMICRTVEKRTYVSGSSNALMLPFTSNRSHCCSVVSKDR